MKDIAIAFFASTLAAVVLGVVIDATTASTAFGVMFPAVIAVLERRERERGRRREATPPPEPPPAGATLPEEQPGRGASYHAPANERREPQRQGALLSVDWRRVAIGTIASVILIGPTILILMPVAALFAFIFESELLFIVPMILAVSIMLATGFWVGRRSTEGGLLGASIMGSIVGTSIPLILLFVGGLDQDLGNIAWAFLVFTGTGVLVASIGGLLGARRRYPAPADSGSA